MNTETYVSIWNRYIGDIVKRTRRHKTLITNFSYLSALRVFNLMLPLITYPYLIRVLGIETYGLVIFAQAVGAYFQILVSFGFNISATKEVSIHRDNRTRLDEIVNSVFAIKGALLVLSFILLFILLYFIPEAEGYRTLFFLTMWMCLYEFVFPVWYFQGIERMKYVTYLTLTTRVIFVGLIFLLIKKPSDYLFVPIINGVGAIVAGIFSIILLRRDRISFKAQSLNTLLVYFRKSYVMALAYASNTFKSNLHLVVIKFCLSFSEVAYFDLALKITSIGTTFLDLVSQTVFPKITRERDSSFVSKVIRLSFGASLVFVLLIQIFCVQLVDILGGADMRPVDSLLRVLVLFVPIYVVGALVGRNCLIVHGYEKHVLLSMFYSSVAYVLLVLMLTVSQWAISLMSITVVFIASYAFETGYRYRICKSERLL